LFKKYFVLPFKSIVGVLSIKFCQYKKKGRFGNQPEVKCKPSCINGTRIHIGGNTADAIYTYLTSVAIEHPM